MPKLKSAPTAIRLRRSWADDLARRLVYQRIEPHDEFYPSGPAPKLSDCADVNHILEIQHDWHFWANQMPTKSFLTNKQKAEVLRCMLAGVDIRNQSRRERTRTCWHNGCPFCWYRRTRNLAIRCKKMGIKRWTLFQHQYSVYLEADDESLGLGIKAESWRFDDDQFRRIGRQILRRGFVWQRLMPVRDEDTASFYFKYRQLVVGERGEVDDVLKFFEEQGFNSSVVTVRKACRLEEVLEHTGYAPDFMDVPWTIHRILCHWNRRCLTNFFTPMNRQRNKHVEG